MKYQGPTSHGPAIHGIDEIHCRLSPVRPAILRRPRKASVVGVSYAWAVGVSIGDITVIERSTHGPPMGRVNEVQAQKATRDPKGRILACKLGRPLSTAV